MKNLESKSLNVVKYEIQNLANLVSSYKDEIGCSEEILMGLDMAIEAANKALRCISAKELMGKTESEAKRTEFSQFTKYEPGFAGLKIEKISDKRDEFVKLNRKRELGSDEKEKLRNLEKLMLPNEDVKRDVSR